jgi:enamine deaminase RidA (YjgF/YER057c/UK114 family)
MESQRVFSGAPWEKRVGYCRAVKRGNFISVSGTAPVAQDGSVFAPGDGYAQAKRCLAIIQSALENLGSNVSEVIRTRIFVTDIKLWEEFGRAHAEVFGDNPPATTMVEVKALIDPAMLIEIEADAITAYTSTASTRT